MPPISFRARLLLLVALAVLPALVLILYNAREQRDDARQTAERDAMNLAEIEATGVLRNIDTAYAALVGLSTRDDVISGASGCGDQLASVARAFQIFASLYVVSPDGILRCSSGPTPPASGNVRTESINRALASNQFALGSFTPDPITGRPSADVSLPVLRDSEVVAVVVAGFDLDYIARGVAPDMQGSTFYVVDHAGHTLISAPRGSVEPGVPLPAGAMRDRALDQQTPVAFETHGPDGVLRVYGARPLIEGDANTPYVIYGTPSSQIFADARSTLVKNLVALAVVAAIAMGAAWTFGDLFFLRRVRALAAGTRAVAAGDLSVRVPDSAGDELGQLAHSFNDMTSALAGSISQVEEKEAEQRALFAAMTDVIFVMSRDGICLRVADTGFPGVLPLHLVGQSIHDTFPPEDARAFQVLIECALLTGQTVHREYSLNDLEGRQRWFEPAISRLTADTAIWVARDITDRREITERLKEQEAQYRGIFEATSDGIAIVGLDGVPVDVNAAMCRMHGYSREEFLALPPGAYVHSEYRGLRARILEGVFGGQSYHVRARDVRKDGTVFDVDVTGTAVSYRGEPHVLAVVRDVTEQVQAERLLEERVEERTREIGTLLSVSRSIAATIDLGQLRTLVLDQLREAVGYAGCAILVNEGGDLVVLDARGPVGSNASALLGQRFQINSVEQFRGSLDRGVPIIIDDVRGDDADALAFREALGLSLESDVLGYVRSWLGVPLVVNDRTVGILSLNSDQPGFYTSQGASLALAIGTSTASAIENARLFAETEARSREVETLLNVSRAVASTIDLDRLGPLILDRLQDAVGYEGCLVLWRQGPDFTVWQARVPEGADASVAFSVRLSGEEMPVLAPGLLNGEPVIIEDVTSDHPHAGRYRGIIGPLLDDPAFSFVRCWLGVPLVVNERMVGLIGLSASKPGFYTPHDASLALAIGTSTANAIENARLFSEAEARTHELATLLDVSRTVASTLELETLFAEVLEQLRKVVPYAGASILRVEGADLVMIESRGSVPGQREDEAVGFRFPAESAGTLRDALYAGRASISPDILGDDDHARSVRAILGDAINDGPFRYIRSQLVVPLSARDRTLGAMSISRREIDAFTPRDLELATAFANQVAIAIDNAGLFERAEVRTRELTTLLEVSRGVVSTIEIGPLLETIQEQLRLVIPYAGSSIMRLDGDELIIIESRGATPTRELDAVGVRLDLATVEPLRQALGSGQVLVSPDVREGDDFYARTVRQLVGRTQMDAPSFRYVRSQILVPLVAHDKLIGAMTVSRAETAAFRDEDCELARAFASQAAIALDNAELFTRAEGRTRELGTLLEVARSVASTIELRPLLALVLDQLRSVIPYEGATILERQGDRMIVIETRGPRLDQSHESLVGHGWDIFAVGEAGRSLLRNEPSVTADVWGDDDHAKSFRILVSSFTDLDQFAYVHSQMVVPLAGREGVIGAMAINRTASDSFTDADLELVVAFASQAAIGIENARLFQQREQRVLETETLAQIASALTFDRPLGETLDAIAAEVVAATGAVAADVTLTRDGVLTAGGTCNLPPDFLALAGTAVAAGAVSPAINAARNLESCITENAREDILASPEWAPIHALVREAEWDGMVTVPVASRGVGLGSLDAWYRRGEMPGPKEQEFLRAIADQAAIASENALLFEETRERAREQEAIASIAGSLTYDRPLPDLLNELSSNVAAGTGAAASAVVLLNEAQSTIEWQGSFGLPKGYLDQAIRGWVAGGLADLMPLSAGESIVIRDARKFLADNPEYAQVRGFVDFLEWDTFIVVPLAPREHIYGALLVYLREGDEPSAQRLRFLRAITDQATVAVENARLFDQVRSRTRQLQALYRADEELHRSLVLDDVIRALLDVVMGLMESDHSSLISWERGEPRPTVLIRGDVDEATVAEIEESLVRSGRESTVERFAALGANTVNAAEEIPQAAQGWDRSGRYGIQSIIEVPVVLGGELFAVLTASYRRKHAFKEEEKRAMLSLAHRAALAIENARLYQQAQTLAAVEERQRLARELHDSVSQALYGIALGARTARTLLDRDPARATEPVDYVLSLAEAGLAEMRALIFELRPESLEGEGLIAAISKQAAATRARYGVDVEADLCSEPDVPLAIKEALYRITQEGLHNIVKHARATRVLLTLRCEGDEALLDIRDDGIGFDTGGEFPGHLGLRSMRERATRLGGEMQIVSSPGHGTHLAARIPFA